MAESITAIAQRLKRSTRHPDVLALCDYVLSGPVAQVVVPKQAFDRRAYMRDYMRTWRQRKTA